MPSASKIPPAPLPLPTPKPTKLMKKMNGEHAEDDLHDAPALAALEIEDHGPEG